MDDREQKRCVSSSLTPWHDAGHLKNLHKNQDGLVLVRFTASPVGINVHPPQVISSLLQALLPQAEAPGVFQVFQQGNFFDTDPFFNLCKETNLQKVSVLV